MSTNFWEQLQQHQNDLTKSGHMVADYLVQHAAEAQYLSISSLARECKVAEATVFRFCRALGFEGYHEMRIALAQANATGALVNLRAPEPDADTATLCEHAGCAVHDSHQWHTECPLTEAVDKAVALLHSARTAGVLPGAGRQYAGGQRHLRPVCGHQPTSSARRATATCR